jgi:hypothetical protein
MIAEKIIDKTPRQIYSEIRSKLSFQKTKIYDTSLFSMTDYPFVFVLSTGRAGTQTLASILNLSSLIFSYHEPSPKLYSLSKIAYKFSDQLINNNSELIDIFVEGFLIARKDLLNYSIQFNKGYVETSPQNTFLAPAIVSAIPQARFIHLVRDPRYVVRSGIRRKWYGGNLADKNRIEPNRQTRESYKWENYSLFEKNAWLWAETNRKIEEFLQTLPHQQKLFVKSESLFNNDQETIQDIFAFAKSSLPSKAKLSRVLKRKLNHQRTGEFLQVDEWEENLMSTLKSMTGDLITRYGYSLDD